MAATAGGLLEAASAALDAGDYDGAVAAAMSSVDVADTPAGRRMLGALAMIDGRYVDTQLHWEAAFRGFRDAGDRRSAARTAIALAAMHGEEPGHGGLARGWIERARRLLDSVGPCVELGWLELAVMACDRPDIEGLLTSARRALAIAVEFGDPGLQAQAMADEGLALVTHGDVRAGFARLEEALASIAAGEVAPDIAGACFCSMLTACDRSGDVRRAEETVAVIDEMLRPLDGRPRLLRTHCRLAHGSVLLAAGRWREAEALLVEALGPPETPYEEHRPTTVALLAGLRLDEGRIEEAAELLAPFEDHVATCAPMTRVLAGRGQHELAIAVAHRGLEEMRGDALRRAPLLAVLVDVHLDLGDVSAASAAAGQLDEIARSIDSTALSGDVAVATARVAAARGDVDGAIDVLRDAVPPEDRPRPAVRLRLELAELLERRGERASAIAEARAALAAAERLGAAVLRDRAAALLRALGDRGRARSSTSAGAAEVLAALTRREREVLSLVSAGLTNGEIADRLYIAPKTAEHHVGRVLTKLGARSRAEAAALAVRLAAAAPGAK